MFRRGPAAAGLVSAIALAAFPGVQHLGHARRSAGATPGKAGDWIPKPTEICQISSHVNHRRATAFGSIATIHHS